MPQLLCKRPGLPGIVHQIEALLTAFGVRGPYRLQGLGPEGERSRYVELSARDGSDYKAYVGGINNSVSISRGDQGMISVGSFHPVSTSGPEEVTVRRWLSAMHAERPYRMVELSKSDKGVVSGFAAILRGGYPFISYPRYGYQIAFQEPEDRFLSFSSDENVPPIDEAPAKLDEAGALAALKQIWDSEVVPHRPRPSWRLWYKLTGKPELGYYLQPGRTKAGLAWRVQFDSYRDVGSAIQGGGDAMLIDAVTGEHISTKTVP